jgi:hypothetical protein
MPLTNTAIRSIKPSDKPQKLYDADGLFLLLNPNGSKWWRFKYRIGGKEKLLSLGTYPEISLKDARERRDDARKAVKNGIDPSEQRQSEKAAALLAAATSFEAIANEWMMRQTDKSESTRNKNQWLLQFAIDDFGRRPIAEITPTMVLATCRTMEKAGKLETANRIKSKCSQVFRYAVATGRLERDPTNGHQRLCAPAIEQYEKVHVRKHSQHIHLPQR